MNTKLTTFKLPIELHKKIKEIAAREGRDMTSILIEELQEYVKIHGEGNPVYVLDNFTEPDFRIAPALFSKHEKILSYYQTIKTHQEYKELDRILNVWLNIHNKEFKKWN